MEYRIDLISHENKNAYAKHMHEILHVKNAPIGKWPSQYMPAIMQQIAINLAIQKGASSLFEGNSQVFSVNGPPGTGKTTLLKEIIVHNIVERAKLLAEYDEPDDAFIEHSFQHGSKYNRAYSKYTQHWYSFKDDRINDYSILVASCNNAAVENLSKELPLGDRILKDLGYNEHAKSDGLNEVSNLFDFQKSSEIEYYEKGSVQCPDIYFTYYAQQLLDNQNAWGLIAASLGKKKNIRDFYNYVLKPLRWDFYPKKESSANRLPDFITAKEMFLSQLELVLKMRNQIIQCCDYAYEQINLCEKKQGNEKTLSQLKEESELKIAEYHKTIRQLQTQSADEKRKIKNLTFERDQMLRKQGALKRQIQKEKDNISELKRKASHTMNAVGRKPILFGKAAYSEKIRFAKRVVEDYENQEEQHRTKIDEIQINYQKNEADCLSKELKCNQYKENLRNLENQIKDMNAQIIDYDQRLNHANQELKKIEERLKIVNEDYSITVGNIGVTQTINEDFINALLSDDEQISSDAHVKNPWFTAKYNREREKLFYYAMKLNKAFILASKKCRDNFTSLSHFWGMLPGDEKERIVFHKDDRIACVSALYQTLFLLVPVISTTFASVGSFFGDAKKKNVIGTLVIDEAGQAQPQMAVGALYRSRKAIIVGDPKQIEPVVLDDLKLLKNAFHDKDLEAYVTNKYISVQYCADQMNAYGTYLEETDHPDHLEWIGCPLVVHRRCISPMYDISNAISYNGIMKKKTALPSSDLEQSFIYEKSQWIQIEGIEKGNKNHFVTAQADKVCEMLEIAFEKEKNPSVYIISPFTTVVSGIKKYIQSYCRNHTITVLSNCEDLDAWLNTHIGTVHTFQGKEANEVIFLLGCDKSKGAEGAIKWVNSNIVNVAVTRAKFRLYVIGDATIWQNNPYVQMAKHIIDTFAIKEIHSILKEKDMEERAKKQALKHAMKGLPSITSFPMCEDKEDGNTLDVSVQTDNFVQGLEVHAFMNEPLSSAQLSKFGLKNIHELMRFSPKVRKNLIFGMRLYYFLQPLYCKEQDFDASCCAILFCKAMELQMKECFKKGLCNMFPDDEFKNMKLSQVNENDLTLGAINYIIKHHVLDLGKFMKSIQNTRYDSSWWKEFVEKASKGTRKRNQCCHANSFLWKDLSQLLAYMFKKNKEDQKVAGLMFESSIGKKLVCDNTSKVSAK